MTDFADENLGVLPSKQAVSGQRADTGARPASTARRGRRTGKWSREQLLYRTASVANATDNVEAAARGILAELCQSGMWQVGRAYLRVGGDRANNGCWLVVTAGVPPLPTGFTAGERVVSSDPAEWMLARAALTQDRGIAETIDCSAGLRAGCAVPVRYQGRVLGAIELYTAGALPRERGLLDTLLEAGEQLAQVVVRMWNHREALRQQQELSQTGRLASMRELARNLAHEVNQPLAAVVSYAGGALQLLEQGRADPGKLKRALEQVGAQAKRASCIIQDFRESLRREDMRHERLDPRVLVRETASLMENAAQEAGATLQIRLPPEVPAVEGDPVQLQQVLINLIRNAIESLSSTQRSPRLLEVAVDGGDQVEIRVCDSGVGMADDLLPQLFTPFLTTKPHGLGMGLSVSRSIVEFHGGRMSAENNPDGGMTFRVRLPLAR
jgi:signal transduction histidine kinase